MDIRKHNIGWGLALGAMAAAGAQAQGLPNVVFNTPHFGITYENSRLRVGWDSLDTPPAQWAGLANPPKVAYALEGFAMMNCEHGNAPPNLDSLAASLAAQYGGHVTKGADSAATLGSYAFVWREYLYDSLPGLSVIISQAAGFAVTLRNGKIRVYSTQANGQVFTMPVLPVKILPVGVPNPFPDVEAALKTLVLKPSSGIKPMLAARKGGLWSRGGRLGGDRLRLQPPTAIACFDGGGAFAGMARPSATPGVWQLPSRGYLALRLLMPGGESQHYFARP